MLSLALTWHDRQVRMVGTQEAPEWVAADVCAVLGLSGTHPWARIPAAEKGSALTATPGGPQKLVTVKLPGLLRLILRSDKPEAEAFQTWTVAEVLPTIFRYGCYPAPESVALPSVPDLRDPKQLAVFALQLTGIVAEQTERLAIAEPKAEVHDRLLSATGTIGLQVAAKILGEQLGGERTGHGPNQMIKLWGEDGIIHRRQGKWVPAQEHEDAKRFEVRFVLDDSGDRFYAQTFVTGRGLQWLAGRYEAAIPSTRTELAAMQRSA